MWGCYVNMNVCVQCVCVYAMSVLTCLCVYICTYVMYVCMYGPYVCNVCNACMSCMHIARVMYFTLRMYVMYVVCLCRVRVHVSTLLLYA